MKPSKESELKGTYCNCPVECESTIYTQELSQATRMNTAYITPLMGKLYQKHLAIGILDKKIENATEYGKIKLEKKYKRVKSDLLFYSSIVHFYFKERGIVQYSREQLYTPMDVIGKLYYFILFQLKIDQKFYFKAAFGGIIGLCMGFSLLSGVEFIYWFTLRLFMDHCRKKNKTMAK